MNNKGQITVGALVLLAIGVIVALVLFQPIASNVEQGTRANTGSIVARNTSVTGGVIGTIRELTGQELVSTQVVVNGSDTLVAAANYSVYECVRASDGLKGICYKSLGAGDPPANGTVKVSYTYYPDGYIDDSGGRAVAAIIIILGAIAIAFVVFYNMKTGDWEL